MANDFSFNDLVKQKKEYQQQLSQYIEQGEIGSVDAQL